MGVRSYQELLVWQKAMEVVVECYSLTEKFPKSEMYGLTNQLRRAAVSVPANIAEGQARQYTAEFMRFISISYGSLAELETHIQIAQRLNYLELTTSNQILERCAEIGRMLNGLLASLEVKLAKEAKTAQKHSKN